ncbi:MAG: hypothetical protein ACI970_000352, partial [Myxococcota bacterium]
MGLGVGHLTQRRVLALALLDLFDQLRHDLVQVADDPKVG